MRALPPSALLCFALLLLLASPASRAEQAPAGPPAPPRIDEVRVEGALRIPPAAILEELVVKAGVSLDERAVREDVRRLHATGRYQDVSVEIRPGPGGGQILVFRVVERSLLARVVLDGNTALSDDDIEAVVDLKPGEVLDEERLDKNVEKIAKLYTGQGFHGTEVAWEVVPAGTAPADDTPLLDNLAAGAASLLLVQQKKKAEVEVPSGEGAVDVVMRIVEGSKVKVQEVRFTGNDHVSAEEIQGAIRTKKDVPLAELLGWGFYREDVLAVDMMAIEALYQERGYLEVKVGPPEVKLSPDKTEARITLPIEEGLQYRVGRVRIDGDLVVDELPASAGSEEVRFTRSHLKEQLGLKQGALAARSRIAGGISAIAQRYRDRGYAYVNVTPNPKVDQKARTIDLELAIDAGPRVVIERIDIAGNTKTRDHVVRRELRLYEGEWFSSEKLTRSEERVRALGYFKDVKFTTQQGSAPDRMVVTADVQEKSTGMFRLGAGFSSAESFMLNGSISYDNFLGLGQKMAVAGELSAVRRIFDVGFADPYLFHIGQQPISFSAGVYNRQSGYVDFLRSATGANVTFGYPVGRNFSLLTENLAEGAPRWLRPYVPDLENLQLYVSANAERVRVQASDSVLLPGVDVTKPRYTTAIEAALVFDQRNNRLFPSAGYFLQAKVEVASPWLGSAWLPGAEAFAHKTLVQAGLHEIAKELSPAAVANDFQRFSMNGRFYLTLDEWLPIKGVVAKANVELGYLHSNQELPFESYYMGGITSVRGYYSRSISPSVSVPGDKPDDPSRYVRPGGNKQLLMNVELEFPIFEPLGIRGVAFFDAGNVWGRDENFFYLGAPPADPDAVFDPSRDLPLGLYSSVGLGVRWFSPIGPLRFEWGFPLTPRPVGTPGMSRGDQPMMFEFTIGGSF